MIIRREVKVELIIKLALFMVGLFCAIIVFRNTRDNYSLNKIFLLPLSFSFACMFMKRIIMCARDSFAIMILYALIVLRYLASPVLISFSRSLVPGVSTSSRGIAFAIIIMAIELFTIVLVVNIIWKPIKQRESHNYEVSSFRITWIGALVCFVLIAIVLYRGTLPNILEHLSFGYDYNISMNDLMTYDMSAFLSVKTFICLIIISWLTKKYQQSNSSINRLIFVITAITVAGCNSLIYDATTRATMVMCALSSLTVLLYCFENKIKYMLPIIAAFGFVFVWSLFSYGTLGLDKDESIFDRQNYICELSYVAELYSNGVSTEAHSFDMYDEVTSQTNISSFISELIKSNSIFSLPGIWIVSRFVDSIPSIQRVFNSTLKGKAYILPNWGLAMYCGSKYFGWIIDILFHYIIIAGMYYFYKKRQNSNDISRKYLYSYCEMICSFAFINNLMIAVSLLSALPFLLFILIKLNEIGIKKA